jgi:hypothetical protein
MFSQYTFHYINAKKLILLLIYFIEFIETNNTYFYNGGKPNPKNKIARCD